MTGSEILAKLRNTGSGADKPIVYSEHTGNCYESTGERGDAAKAVVTEENLPVGDNVFVLHDGVMTEFEVVYSNDRRKVMRIRQTQVGPSKGKPGSMSGTAHGIGNAGQRKS